MRIELPWRRVCAGPGASGRALVPARSGRPLAVIGAVAACVVLVPGCGGGSVSGNPATGGPGTTQDGGVPPGTGHDGVSPEGPGTARDGVSVPGGPGSGDGGAPGNPAGGIAGGKAPGNPGGSGPEVQARGIPVDLGSYKFSVGASLAAEVRSQILDDATPGCQAKGLPDDCVQVVVTNVDDRVQIPDCPEVPEGQEPFSGNEEVLADFGYGGIDRQFNSSEVGDPAQVWVGRQPPDIVHVYSVHCRVTVTTTTTTVPPTTTIPPTTTTTAAPEPPTVATSTPEVARPSAISTIAPEIVRPSATVGRSATTTTTESSGG